jgi:hypothetical protein
VEGKHSVTASNIAKFDGWHSVVIFKKVDPLIITAEEVADHIDTGGAGLRKRTGMIPRRNITPCYGTPGSVPAPV